MLKRLVKTAYIKKGLLFLAIFFGINLAFYFSAYLENSPILIPLGSTRMWAYVAVVSGVGTLFYFAALTWAKDRLISTGNLTGFKDQSGLTFASLLIGTMLFFTNTSQWLQEGFYVRAVLPISYELHIPFYASTGMAFVTGVVFYATLVYLLLALLLPKKDEILKILEEKLQPSAQENHAPLDFFLISLFVFSAFLLRVFNLNILPPHIEEYQHLIAAKQLLSGTPASEVYQRGFYLVTLPVKFTFTLSSMNVWAARLPGVIVNSLALIPLYELMRRFNKKVAIISAALYTTSPWIIALARPVREYAYQPLMYYLVLASALYLLSTTPRGFLLAKWCSLFARKKLWAWIILAFFVIFVLVIDPFSSFKVIALLYLVFAIFALTKLDLQDRLNRRILLGFGLVAAIGIGAASVLILTNPAISALVGNPFKALQVNDILLNFRNGSAKLLFGQFFFQPPTQWYYGRLALFPVLSLFFAAWWGWRTRKSNPVIWFLVVLFSLSLMAFALLYTYIFAPRFFLHLQLWFIPLLAVGVYGWYLVSTVLLKDAKWRALLWLFVAVATINFPQLLVHTTDAVPVTYAVHMDFAEVDAYMRTHAQPADVLLSKFYHRYVVFHGEPVFAAMYETSYDEDIIAAHESGWIVVDSSRYWAYQGLLKRKNFFVGDVELEFIGEFPDPTSGLSNYIWHWDTMP